MNAESGVIRKNMHSIRLITVIPNTAEESPQDTRNRNGSIIVNFADTGTLPVKIHGENGRRFYGKRI